MIKDVFLPIVTIWVLVAFAVAPSCHKPETGPNAGINKIEIGKSVVREGYSFEIIEIDSCEYIAYSVGKKQGILTHKGNCKNKAHCR